MQRGYILVELLIILAITSMVAGMAMLSMKGLNNTLYEIELDGAAHTLAADIRWLQQASINAGKAHGYIMQFQPFSKPHYYSITDSGNEYKRFYFTGDFKNIEFVVAPDSGGLTFNSEGAPLSSGYQITLRHTKANPVRTRELTILPVTGRILLK